MGKLKKRLEICRRLGIDDLTSVEIESKKRVRPDRLKDVSRYFAKRKKIEHQKTTLFFDQFLDTPRMDLIRRGVSLRLRYKRNGTQVYLQYKGPGIQSENVMYRAEFSTGNLERLFARASGGDVLRFRHAAVRDLIARRLPESMAEAMRRHLGARVVSRISAGFVISIYEKDKYLVDLGDAYLEPSLDRISAFQITPYGLHPLSSFCEYENEVKSWKNDIDDKVEHIPELLEFDHEVARKFNLRAERRDKYQRCAENFYPGRSRAYC